MASIPVKDMIFEVDIQGRKDDPPIVLIAGLAGQLTSWREEFVKELASKDFCVIRFDNRDAGLSSRVTEPRHDHAKVPESVRILNESATYTIFDMAGDLDNLLDQLGIKSAHIVGMSMGGMIAQAFAINHPEKVRSLCSIMSTNGAQGVGMPSELGLQVVLKPPPQGREAIIEHELENYKTLSSPGFPFDEQKARRYLEAQYDRNYDMEGAARQLFAILATGDRSEELNKISCPTLVIHGDADPLVDVSGGIATKEAIPGAKLQIIAGMGHEIPEALFPEIAELISQNANENRS